MFGPPSAAPLSSPAAVAPFRLRPASTEDERPEVDRNDAALATLLPDHLARRDQATVLRRDDGRLIVGMVDPADLVAVDDLRAVLREPFTRVAITAEQLAELLDERNKLDDEVLSVAQIVVEDSSADQQDLASLASVVEDAPIVKFVNLLITQAVQDRASDIHVEPTEHDLRIRFRIDGVLHEVMRSPRSSIPGVISRLKVMADINIAERRIPQDGRITLSVEGKAIDLRVATLPTVYGEKIVMRILDKGQACCRSRTSASCPSSSRSIERRTASRTARSSSPARPVPASRRRSTPRSTS